MQNTTGKLAIVFGTLWFILCGGFVLAEGVLGPNLILNPGFEDLEASGKPRYWDFMQHSPDIIEGGSYDGSTCVRIKVSDTTSPYVRQPRAYIKVQANSTYVLSAMVKPENIAGRFQFKFEWYDKDDNNHAGEYVGTTTGSSGWEELTVTRVAPPGAVAVAIYLRLYGPGTILADNVSLRKYDTLPPNEVGELKGKRNGWTSSTLSWIAPSPAEDGDLAAAYNIYRKTAPFTVLDDAEMVGHKIRGTTWVDQNITSSNYYYAVTALDELGLESDPMFVSVPGVARLSGQVLDQEGKGLDGVTLRVHDFEGEYSTETSGFFNIPMVEAGPQIIRAYKKGYRWEEKSVTIEAGKDLECNFLLVKDGAPPPAPFLIEVSNEEPGLLRLTWKEPELGEKTIAGYDIYRSKNGTFSEPQRIAHLYQGESYSDLEVEFGREYWYAIVVIDTAFNESRYSQILSGLVIAPPKPFNLSPQNQSKYIDEPIIFAWEEVANSEYYILEIAKDPSFSAKSLLRIEEIPEPSYPYKRIIKDGNKTVELGLPDGEWFWRVRSRLDSGVTTEPSTPSALISVNTQYRLDDAEPREYNLSNPGAGQKSVPLPFYQVTPKTILANQAHVEVAFVVATQLPVYADLAVYNMAGKPVCNLFKGNVEPGLNTYHWNGKDNQNRDVANGLYLVRLQIVIGNQKTTYVDKVIVMR